MRNRFTLFLMLMFLMGTGMNAQTVVAKMKALADAAGNSDTKATVSTVWKSDDAEGAVYEFSNGKYLGAISNTDVVSALEGDKYVTIAMWVYGRTTPTGFQCVFGYGNVNDGVKFQQNGKSISATTKGVINIGGWDRDELLDDEWNLIAFAVAGKANTTVTTGKYYINDINANQNGLKLSGMAETAEGNKLLAIGSGDQNIARETYNGMIANLTVITSDDLLTNNKIKELVGTVSRIDGKRRVTINYTCASGTFSKKTYFAPNEVNTVPTPDFYTNVDPATITDDNSSASYNVNCDENFPFTAGTFCKLKLREKADNNRCVVWDGTSANINTRKSEAEATNAGMGSYWRFERVPNTENQVRLFTNCKGKSQAVTFTNMATDGQAATLTDNGTIFMVKTGNSEYTAPKGFRLSSLTNDDYNVNDVESTLGVWANGLSKTDGGSTFTVYAIDAQPTEVTSATCTDENGITATYSIASKGYYWNGTASDAVSAPVLPGYMAATTASITDQGALSFDYTNNYPFVVSTDNAKYFQSLRVRNDNTHYVTATYNSGSFAAGTTKSSNNGIATDETKQGVMKSGWAFVKEPGTINKFRIYNEATGNLQLYLQNQSNKTAATMAASGTAFVIELQPTEFTAFTGGFTIRVNENDSHALGDHGNGALAYWCERNGGNELNDAGSIFRVAESDVWVEQVYTDFVTNSDAWVASLVNQSAASLPAYTAAKEAAATVISNNNSTNAQKMQAYRKVAQSLYTAKTNLLAEADAAQIYKLRSLTNSGDLYLHVKNNDNKGVIITKPIKYLKNQMFQLVKDETSGQYAIKCIADNSMLLNSSTGSNWWDIKSATDPETYSKYTLGNVYNGNYTISKEAGNYLSPDGTRQADGTYIMYSNITTANAWAFEPVSATDAAKGDNENYKALYELYKTYLPYKNLYVAEKAGLPGYPTSYENLDPAFLMDDQLKSAETLLNKPTSPTTEEVEPYRYMFPYVRESLEANLVNYPENRYFSIKNTDNRGYLVYAADAPKGTETGSGEEWNYVWSTGKSYNVTNGEETTPVSVTFDASNAAHLWCFLNHTKVGGTAEHYLYNVGLKKYARPTKVVGTYGDYTWVLTDEPAPITLKVYDAPNHKMAITAKSAEVASDTEVYASVSNNYTGPVINYYSQNDGGVPFTFDWSTVEFAASDTTDVAALVRTPITLRTVVKNDNPLITGLDDNQTICTYSSTKAFRVPAGVTAYYAKEKDANDIVRLKAVPDGIVPANEGVLLVGAVNKTKAMLDVDYRTEARAENNIFSNTASGPTEMGANCYILAQTVDQGIGFYHAEAGTTLKQGLAYLDFSGNPVRAFTLSFGDGDVTTGISNIEADGNDAAAPVYDLSGRRIAQPSGRGIYIKNGKKYFVK